MSADDLHDQYCVDTKVVQDRAEGMIIDPACIPSMRCVHKYFKSGRKGAGHGEDALPYDFYHVFADQLTKVMWPLWLKFSCRLE